MLSDENLAEKATEGTVWSMLGQLLSSGDR